MSLESRVDILIVGAGPAGLMCATALAMAGVDVRIIDKRPAKVAAGHADGIQPRTTEVLESYGLADRLVREGNQLLMGALYGPSRNGGIEFTRRFPRAFLPINARYPFTITLHQGVMEDIFLDSIKERGVAVERPKLPVDIEISSDVDELSSTSSYPVKVTVERSDSTDQENKTEIVHAKFVVGADGAHSWVRKALGIEMEGEQTDDIWGAVEMVPETNFPDFRNGVIVHSENGSLVTIPREGDLVRFYIQLLDNDVIDPLTGRVDKTRISPQQIISLARKILHPFEFADPKEIVWWSVYVVSQRVTSSYSVHNRVFIAGDACHTNSPNGGQGMNAGITDSHNLAWKLVQVLRGWSSLSLLNTYEQERRKYAQDIIEFDKEISIPISGKPRTVENEDGITPKHVLSALKKFGAFITGLTVHYPPSNIVDPKHQKCANWLIIGQRMPFQTFIRVADARPVEIHELLPSDIRFKVLFFVGDLTETRVAELKLLAEGLNMPSSFLRKYSPDGKVSTVFDLITITAGSKKDINFFLVPPFFRPHWTKVLLDDTDVTKTKGGHAYERFGMNHKQVMLVIVRPDGHVGTIAPSTALSDLDNFFGSFMFPREHPSHAAVQHPIRWHQTRL